LLAGLRGQALRGGDPLRLLTRVEIPYVD
jgi:hypothetical protein